MRLGVVFVFTLAVSVIISSTATWGLTYATSYNELQDMSSGFVGLATTAVDDFGKLVKQLIGESSDLVSGILTTEYNRSTTQLNETGQMFLQTTLSIVALTKNATSQAQGLVAALVVSFRSFMRSVIADFEAMETDYASRLRMESASRAQLVFSDMLQNRILAIQRSSRLYKLGMTNLTWIVDQPLDKGTCTLMGSVCSVSSELGLSLYIGTAGRAQVSCDVTGVASTLVVQQGQTTINFTYLKWPPYDDSDTDADFSIWKQSCLDGSNDTWPPDRCRRGEEMSYPNRCNATCGYDPRCRPWYTIHDTAGAPRTRMSDVYIDAYLKEPVITLSYPIHSSPSPTHTLLAVAATDFYLSSVDDYLRTLSSTASQLVAVIFNSSDLLVVGTSQVCLNSTQRSSGNPVTEACDASLRGLGGWLVANRGLASNVSLELDGTLWDVFPATVDSFSYFVAVGMNKTEVYAVITATSQAADQTLQNLSQQQSARLAVVGEAALLEIDAESTKRIASLAAMEVQFQQSMKSEYATLQEAFNVSRQRSANQLSNLTSDEMAAIDQLENYHLSQMAKAIGVTFGAVVGIFAGILLLGSYGTWAVTKQVQQIAEVMEDLAQMRVEELTVVQKSSVREVQRIEAALGVLVRRLAEYKSYMPAGLFQAGNAGPPEEECNSPVLMQTTQKRSVPSPQSSSQPRKVNSMGSLTTSMSGNSRPSSVVGNVRLLRRSATAMVVNVARFQAEAVQRPASYLEGHLNRFISVVHSAASKSQGNVDAVVGDQVLVTFNAHFACPDQATAASSVALEVMGILKADGTFPWQVQIGLAAGQVYAGHLGYASFKSMSALGASMKVASLLAHLSGFNESVVLACPSVEERIKYSFVLQPADLVTLPGLGEHISLYSRSICVFVLEADGAHGASSQEWLYEVGAGERSGQWTAMFHEVARASSVEKARKDLSVYAEQHPQDHLARRLLNRLPLWQPRAGIELAERPDAPRLMSTHGEDHIKYQYL